MSRIIELSQLRPGVYGLGAVVPSGVPGETVTLTVRDVTLLRKAIAGVVLSAEEFAQFARLAAGTAGTALPGAVFLTAPTTESMRAFLTSQKVNATNMDQGQLVQWVARVLLQTARVPWEGPGGHTTPTGSVKGYEVWEPKMDEGTQESREKAATNNTMLYFGLAAVAALGLGLFLAQRRRVPSPLAELIRRRRRQSPKKRKSRRKSWAR